MSLEVINFEEIGKRVFPPSPNGSIPQENRETIHKIAQLTGYIPKNADPTWYYSEVGHAIVEIAPANKAEFDAIGKKKNVIGVLNAALLTGVIVAAVLMLQLSVPFSTLIPVMGALGGFSGLVLLASVWKGYQMHQQEKLVALLPEGKKFQDDVLISNQ